MRTLLIAGLLLLSAAAARADMSSTGVGTSAAQFLRLGVGARALAMGEAYTALADDASALYWNPAGLALVPNRYLAATAMHAPYVASSYYDYLGYAQNLGSYGSVGASFQYFTVGAVQQTSMDGTSLGVYNPNDMALSLGYAQDYKGFLFGVAAKYVTSRIATSAQTLAGDAGVLSPAYLDDRLRLAVVAQNVGGKLHFDQADEPLPRVYKGGLSWRFNERWLASADLGLPRDDSPYGAVGLERTWKINPGLSFSGRAGFNSRTIGSLDGVAAVTMGVGFAGRDASLDYAFVPMGTLGATHRFSLSCRFDTRRLKRAPRPPKAAKKKEEEASSVQAQVQYSTQTSLPPPSRLHCEEYHGVTVCMDADQREHINISYDPGEKPQEPAAPPSSSSATAPSPAPAEPAPVPSAPSAPPAGPDAP